MTPNEYQVLAMRTNDGKDKERLNGFSCKVAVVNSMRNRPLNGAELICGAMGLNGEAGEVVDLIKKIVFHGHEFDIDAICKELGDVCWYVALVCNSLGINLEDVMQKNIDKLKERYPDGFTEKASINRKID